MLVAAPTAALFFVGLFDPANMMLGSFDSVQRAAAGLARIVGVTLGGPAPKERPEGPITHPGTALVVHDVHHRYSTGPDVLHGVRLELPAGKPLEIVGATGSGKSTLATGASDGRRRIMLVTQEHHLFLGTVADNLRLARRDASPSDLAAALAAVGATGWIDALPDCVDTPVGTGGVDPTPRRTQQLALARVLLLDPEVVVMDEATAEGGSDTAQALDRAALAAAEGRAAVVVAHRLSRVATADVVVVMDEGRGVERGRPDELRSAGGIYARLSAAWERGTG